MEVRTVNKDVEKMQYNLIRRSSSETREVQTVNKDVEKMQEIGEKRHKCRIYLNFIMAARLARRLAGFLPKNGLSFVSNHARAFLLLYVLL